MPARTKSVQKKTTQQKPASKKNPSKGAPAGKAARSKPTNKKPVKHKKRAASLGRPTVSNEDLLFMVFREDFHARQIFEFLRVSTVKELEQFSANEIVDRLSEPVRISVERIRRRLAECNRCLSGDFDYALNYKAQRQ
jgi:hypothetical protein